MKFVLGTLTAVVQFVVGYLAIFFGAMLGLSVLLEALGLVGPENVNPWWNTPLTFVSFMLAASFGVWIVGWVFAKIRKGNFGTQVTWWGTLAGSALGIIIISIIYVVQGAVGFMPVLFALGGALAGYYVHPRIWK